MNRSPAGLWRTGLRAGMVAAVINVSLYRFGLEWGVFSDILILPHQIGELTLAPLILTSISASLAGTLLYRILAGRVPRPLNVLCGITLSLLLLFSFAPLAIQTWTTRQIAYVNLMHVVVASSTMVALWHWERRRLPTHSGPAWP